MRFQQLHLPLRSLPPCRPIPGWSLFDDDMRCSTPRTGRSAGESWKQSCSAKAPESLKCGSMWHPGLIPCIVGKRESNPPGPRGWGILPEQTESGTSLSGNPERLRKQVSPGWRALPTPADSGQTPVQVAALGDSVLAHLSNLSSMQLTNIY